MDPKARIEGRWILRPDETRVSSSVGQIGAYDTSTRGMTQQRPIPVKRPARLTWSKAGGPAHGKPINSMFEYSPFTAC